MGHSSKKPFLRPVKRGGPWGQRGYALGIIDFYSTPTYHMKEIVSKFSEFEKPYDGGGFQEMQVPTFPPLPYVPVEFPPLPPYDPEPLPLRPLPLPPSNWSPPPPSPPPGFAPGCHFVDGLGRALEPGEHDPVAAWAEDFAPRGEPIVDSVATGPMVFFPTTFPGYFVSGKVIVDSDAADGELLELVMTTASGKSCKAAGSVVVACDDPATYCAGVNPTISYTTLQMQVDEEQEFEITDAGSQPACLTFEVSAGEGTISGDTYTAPSTNAECADNPTVSLMCNEVEQDSIGMAVNAVGTCQIAAQCCCQCTSEYNCIYYWSCYGTPVPIGGCNCPGGSDSFCDWGAPYECDTSSCKGGYDWHPANCCQSLVNPCDPAGWADVRTEAQKTAGCCPEQLL